MAATILSIADALVASLNAAVFTAPYDDITATRSYAPRFTLEELASLKVTVIPPDCIIELAARSLAEADFTIAIGVQKRTDGTQSAHDALMLLVQELALHVLDLDLGDAHAATVEFDPLYDPGLLREERTFTSVMVVTFKQGLAL